MRKGIRSIKRGTAVLLSACMVFGMTPIQAGAEETGISVSGNETQAEPLESGSDEQTEGSASGNETQAEPLESGSDEQTEGSASGNETQTQVEPSGFGSDEQAEGSASGNETQTQMELSGFGSDAQTQAGAEENDSEIAVQANDSAGRTEQQSTDEASVTINGETLYYATLEEAFSAADGKTATINMLDDAECINYAGAPFCVDSGESDITLKMNGKTLSGLGKENCGAITVKEGSLAIQGPGRILSIYKVLSCESNARNIAVENVTFDLNSCDYGIWVDSMYPVILDNVQVRMWAYKGAVYINNSDANVTINNMSAPEYGRCDVVYNGGTLKINGGTFDKISDCVNRTSVSNVLGEGCIYRNNEDKTWVTSDLSNTYEISNVTVEKIPLTINPEAETSWYYNSAEHSLQMNAEPTTAGNEITYEWYNGDTKLECTSDAYTIPKTMPTGSYTYTCKATCDGYTLSHEFKFAVEECKHENVEITFNSNGFGNCPKCNATVYQPEKLPVGVGITANAENSEIVESNSWLEVSCAENNYKTIDYTSSDENTYTCYVYSSTEYSAVLISVNGWSHLANNGVLGYDNQVADLASKGARMPKFAELQILLDAGMNLTKFDNFNCQEYEVAWVENGKWRGQKGNNKYADSTYHAVFEINRNPIETVSDSIFKTDSSPTLSAVKGEDFTWQGNCDIEISYYNSDKTICDSAPAAAGDYYVKVSTPTIEADEDGNTVRYEASESDYIPFTIVHNFPDTFDSNGFKNCPKCNATVYQPATETNDKYDIDDDGTKEAVYEISNAGQLYWFAGLVNGDKEVCTGNVTQDLSAKAVLTADITVNTGVLNADGTLQADAENLRSWTPVGSNTGTEENAANGYSGIFDGQNHTISGLYFDDANADAVGLFGYTTENFQVSGVGITDSYFNGRNYVGAVCGKNNGIIRNCYNTGTVSGSQYVGGVNGYNNAKVANCYNIGIIHAKTAYYADGVAYSFNGETYNSYYLAGCAASGTVFSTHRPNKSKTAEQFACGEVAYLLSQGYTYQWNDQDCESYDGSAWGQDLSREASWPVLDSTKKVYCGYKDCSGKTYANEPLSETPNHKEFDANGFCTVCGGYQPAVKNAKGIYEIGNVGQLYWFAGLVNGTLGYIDQDLLADAVLTKDITVNSNVLNPDGTIAGKADSLRSWTPIGSDYNNQYAGTFDGQNHTISGLYLDNPDKASVGLFGSIGSDYNNGNNKCARISNVNLVDSYFNAGSNVGGVCGQSAYLTSIENCRNAGTVKGDSYVGGICGDNSGTIQTCINTGAVSGTGSSIGGISGQTSRIIVNCYNTGAVSGIRYSVGGVCGSVDYGTIINSYNTGVVSGSESDEYSSIGGVCGQYSNGNIVNCYYLAGCAAEGTTFNNTEGERTKEQFASGEIAYLLDQEYKDIAYQITYDGAVWGQKLGKGGDNYPVFSENKVYRNETYKGCSGNPGEPDVVYSNTKADPVYAEHTDEDLDGKCDICKLDFKTFKQLGLLIAKVNKNLSDGKYADVQYTTASIDNLRMALVAAGTVTEVSSDTDIATAFDKLLAASTVGADGLIKADHNIVISFADAVRGKASGNGWYANGDTVTLKVTPSMGYSFSKWTTDTAGNTSVGTESTYTFTLDAGSPDVYHAWLDEAKYTVTCESVEGGTGKASEEQYVYGQTATVTATANDDYEFVGWKDSYGTTVSTDATYSFTVLGDTALTPEFVKVKTEEGNEIAYVTVSFYHQSGKLLDSQKVVSGEGKINTTVNAPTKVGFDFLGWSAKASGATAEDVVDFETATFSENTSLYPVFKAQDIMYTLTVVGLQTEQKAPQSSVTVTADPIEGKQFVGWKDANGNIVSYDSTYTFIITGDTTLEACYEQADSVIVKEPTIIIAQPTYEDITGGYKMSFYFNYTVPEDCKLVDIGIIRKKGDYAADGITLETDGISQYSVLSKLGSEGQFYYTKSNYYGTGHTVTGYMIYEKNGIRYTVYSDSIYGVKNN